MKLPNFDGVNYSTGLYSLMKTAGVDDFREGARTATHSALEFPMYNC